MKTVKPVLPQAAHRVRGVLPLATVVLVGIVVLSLVAAAMAETGTFRSVIVLQNDYISFEFADQRSLAERPRE